MSSVAKKTGKNSIEDKMYRQSRIFYQILKYVFLTMCCLMVIIPLIVVLIGAFKTHDEYISTGVFTLPEVPQFENFKIAFVNGKVMQGLLNTLIILAVSCFGTIFTGTMTAFVLQRFNMLFTRAVKMVFLIAALLPNISMQVTVFQIVSKLGLYNTLAAPCILYIGTDIISIYIFIQFLNNISKSLDESAILDGASYPRVYFSIILPMLRPAIATVLVIKFVSIYNDFYTGEGSDVLIVAGCGIDNCGSQDSQHDGLHRFFVEKNAHVRYVEKHYGSGDGAGKRLLNPGTEVHLAQGSSMEMEMVQIRGVDSTIRTTTAELEAGARLVVRERLMTHGDQKAESIYVVTMKGAGSSADVVSRSVAKDNSWQKFDSRLVGQAACSGHTECDAIIMDHAKILAVPQLEADDLDAALIHEAAIGKIAGEQIIKLMTLGLTEQEAEEQIISGFLK